MTEKCEMLHEHMYFPVRSVLYRVFCRRRDHVEQPKFGEAWPLFDKRLDSNAVLCCDETCYCKKTGILSAQCACFTVYFVGGGIRSVARYGD